LGNIAFKRATAGRVPLSHLIGLGLLAGLALAVPTLSILALGCLTSLILVLVACWETISLRGGNRVRVVESLLGPSGG
jgi:low temperature requirement protein LtrA